MYCRVAPTGIAKTAVVLLAITGGLRWPWIAAQQQEQLYFVAGQTPEPPGKSDSKANAVRDQVDLGVQVHCADLDPNKDGWRTEALTERVNKRLASLAAWIANPRTATVPVRELVADDVAIDLPGALIDVPTPPGTIGVQRSAADRAAESARGVDEFERRMLHRFHNLQSFSHPHAKFKVVGVDLEATPATTRQLLSADGFEESDSAAESTSKAARSPGMEVHAEVVCEWDLTDPEKPVVSRFTITNMELTRLLPGARRWLRDRAPEILRAVPEYEEFLKQGLESWMRRMPGALLGEFGHHGLAVGDVNGDGREDLYVCQPGGFPNLLLVQQADGSVRNRAAESSVDFLDLSRSALILDLDRDGDGDLLVATSNRLVFLENDGMGAFPRRQVLSTVRDANSLAAADFDRDGDLDIYVCVYSRDGDVSRGSPTPIPIHDARNGGRNVLLRNDGDGANGEWLFVDATDDVGLNENNDRWSYAAGWEDYDDDGDVDLLVANDFGRNNLYRNDQGRFRDVATEAGLDASAFGMSVSWGDYDHDGRVDAYIGNMFSGAGNRITNQAGFQPDAPQAIRDALRQAAQGNALFRNLGQGRFENVAAELGVQYGRWAWGSVFADLNNDTWEDLLVANGFVTSDDPDDL